MSSSSTKPLGRGLWYSVGALTVLVVAIAAVHAWNLTRAIARNSDRPAVVESTVAASEPVATAPAPRGDATVSELADWIRPPGLQERWLAIDWQDSLLDAQRLAEQTN